MVGSDMRDRGAAENVDPAKSDEDVRFDIKAAKQAVVDQYGPWTAHKVDLGHGVFTREGPNSDAPKIRRVVQALEAVVDRPWEDLRVLDLACLEGGYSLELGARGAKVVGVEVREEHLARAEFARATLGLGNVRFVQDDVRNVSVDTYGEFDVVLCLGILYHLPRNDVFGLLDKLATVTRTALVINTHVSLFPWLPAAHGDHLYWGKSFLEHPPFTSLAARRRAVWSSIDNMTSFWPTRPSLVNAVRRAGFPGVFESLTPYDGAPKNRLTLLALKQTAVKVPIAGGGDAELQDAALPEASTWNARAWMTLARRF